MVTIKQKRVVFSKQDSPSDAVKNMSLTYILLTIVLFGLAFSYYPLLRLGTVSGVHIDGSLLYGLIVVTVAVSIRTVWNVRSVLFSCWPWHWLVLFSTYVTLSTLWSPNPFRAATTAGFLWLLVGLTSVVVANFQRLQLDAAKLRRGLTILFAIVGLVAAWQIFGDAIGINSSLTLLPQHYQSSVFGVARPVGFALEPQFLASLLLIPLCWFAYQTIRHRKTSGGIGLTVSTTLLLLTLSRGGLIAGMIVLLVLIVALGSRYRRGCLQVLGWLLLAVLMSGIVYVAAASLNTRDQLSGYDALRRGVSQLTLGVIVLPNSERSIAPSRDETRVQPPIKSNTTAPGYVTSSTSSRLSMATEAISIWREKPSTILFGVGVGGFGAALAERGSQFSAGSVANNFYVELLAENGIIGVLLFSLFIVSIFASLIRLRAWLLIAMALGFMIQWAFFSGYANVVHIWIVLGVCMSISVYGRRRVSSVTIS